MRTFLFITLGFFLFSCKTYKANELPVDQLQFGNGGGFAGKEARFVLLKNGQLFSYGFSSTDTVEFQKVKKSQAKHFYKVIDTKLGTDSTQGVPGNIYRFIRLQSENGSKEIIWQKRTDNLMIDSIYQEMRRLVKFENQ